MDFIRKNNQITILCEGSLTGTAAAQFHQDIAALMGANNPQKVIFDLLNVKAVSASGLRAFLAVSNQGIPVEIVNASGEVYETLDITGLTSLFPVSRKIRSVSIDDAQLIGSGFFSQGYRLSADSIVKVFTRNTSLENIRQERELAKSAFLLGIPAAITFDIVAVDGKYGLVFESINGDSYTQKILSDPEHLEQYIVRYAQLLRNINATKVPSGVLPRAAEIAAMKLETIRPYLSQAEYQALASMLDGIADTGTYVHADCHTGNIMLQNDELMIIDMETSCVGNPIFELSSLYAVYTVYEECYPGRTLQFLKLSKEVAEQVFYGTLRHYFCHLSQQELTDNLKKIQLCGYFHMMFWNRMYEPEDQHMFSVCYRRFQECLREVDNLRLLLDEAL